MVKLFVVGIPRDMKEITLVEIFSVYGQVNTVTIITDKVTGISQGYAFLVMTDEAGAKRAIDALNGSTIGDREISVRVADDKRANENKPPARPAAKPAQSFQRYQKVESQPDQTRKKRPRKQF